LFTNLIGNALKFVRPGVTGRSDSRKLIDGEQLPDLILGQKYYYRLLIADNGIGFDEKYADHIQGLPLPVTVKHLRGGYFGWRSAKKVSLHHKGLNAQSQPDEGPLRLWCCPKANTDFTDLNPFQNGTHSYTLVDDDEDDRYLFAGAFPAAFSGLPGFDTWKTANNRVSALLGPYADASHPLPALILLTRNIPKRWRRCCARLNSICVIFLSVLTTSDAQDDIRPRPTVPTAYHQANVLSAAQRGNLCHRSVLTTLAATLPANLPEGYAL
jgi:hypothetical protein